jgi:hypothetical protein
MDALAGATAIETRAGATVKFNEPLTAFMVAVIETVPLDLAVSIPPAATAAMLWFDEVQLTEPVKSFVLWSL